MYRLIALLAALLGLLVPCAADARLLEIDQAIARVSLIPHPASHAKPSIQAIPVALPYQWDAQHPRQSGEAVFEIPFTLVDQSLHAANTAYAVFSPDTLPPYALYIARIGTVYEVWLNGSLLSAQGYANANIPSDADYAKAPRFFPIPAQLLQSENLLRIAVRVDAGRSGGLSALVLGPQGEVATRYQAAQRWHVFGVLAVLVFSVCVALACALLWITQPAAHLLERTGRDHLTLWAALGELAWALVLADHVLERAWLAWPLWGQLVRVAVFTSAAMAALFAYQAITQTHSVASTSESPRRAWWRVVLVAIATLVCVGAALMEILGHAIGLAGDWPGPPWLVYATTLFGLAVAAITLARYRQDSEQVQDLMATLTQRVAHKERDLQRNYAQLEATARTQESAAERARLLRDMHDSVGSHIGLALQQIHAKHGVAQVLGTLRTCLDQLKLSIDSLQLPAGDVASLLANVRYRLAPRLASAGITLDWQVALLPTLERLDLHAMRQLQHLLFEAISAALALSSGSTLQVQADEDGGVLRIALYGTGAVFDAPIADTWQVRCAAIGAHIGTSPPTSAQSAGLLIEIPVCNRALR